MRTIWDRAGLERPESDRKRWVNGGKVRGLFSRHDPDRDLAMIRARWLSVRFALGCISSAA